MFINSEIVDEEHRIISGECNNTGSFDEDEPNVFTGYSKKNRYMVKLSLKIENGIIIDAKFKSVSCTVVTASTNRFCEMIKGLSITDALKIKNRLFVYEFRIWDRGSLAKESGSVMVEESLKSVLDSMVLNG